jgi:hypothetical protein
MSAYTPVPHCFLRERGKVPILLRPQCLHECALRYAAAATIFSRRYVFGPPLTNADRPCLGQQSARLFDLLAHQKYVADDDDLIDSLFAEVIESGA